MASASLDSALNLAFTWAYASDGNARIGRKSPHLKKNYVLQQAHLALLSLLFESVQNETSHSRRQSYHLSTFSLCVFARGVVY